MVSAFVFLIFLSESLASVSSTSNTSLWPWGAIQPPFPIPGIKLFYINDQVMKWLFSMQLLSATFSDTSNTCNHNSLKAFNIMIMCFCI